MDSLWRSTCAIPAYPALRDRIEAEAAVVGGGMTGLLTAHFLQRAGVETVVLEANRILSGATEGTTAKITAQHGVIYDHLIKKKGLARARQYAQAQLRAIGWYQQLVDELSIDCSFEMKPAHLYSVARSEQLEDECRAAEKLGLPVSLTGAGALPFQAAQALRMEDQAQFHPLRFGAAIAKGLNIREQARVTEVKRGSVRTEDGGEVRAEHIVICTHFPIRNVPGFYFARAHQQRSYVLALEGAPDVRGMWLDAMDGGFSFRNAEGLLLFGGAGHRTGEHPYGSCFKTLRQKAAEFYPTAKEYARWSAQDVMTSDSVPFIGQYARTLPGVYVATGFQKWGMTNAMVAAELLASLIADKQDYPFPEVFRPQRLSGITPTIRLGQAPRCPHMGCTLEWNIDTRTWDCPCHGSRFTRTGRVVSGPAVKDGDFQVT